MVALEQKLRRPEVTYTDLPQARTDLAVEVVQQVEIALKYEGYIQRQEVEVEKFKTLEDKQIPAWVDYEIVHSLRKEARQKLGKIRPATIGQASRISGVSPSDVSILIVWLKRGQPLTIETDGTCAASEHLDESNAHNSCCGDL